MDLGVLSFKMVPPLLLLLMFSSRAITGGASTYNVGGPDATWGIPPYPEFYQDWSNSSTFVSGDILGNVFISLPSTVGWLLS